jgi:hypothetical protein
MNKKVDIITKASGVQVPFSAEKLSTSLQRSGANDEVIRSIISEVKKELYPGITTKKIYKHAHALLKKVSKPTAARYTLKNAIMELGPSGFPFERFFSEILKHEGYSVRVGEIVEGRCVKHEIDVIAEKKNHYLMIECKYHNLPGISCDVKIPLYIHSRFLDVESSWKLLPGHETKLHQGWVVTNTRFTDDAIQYANCAGLHLVGWDYPFIDNLKNMIDRSGLYPITCLTSLTRVEKQHLLSNNVVLCKDIIAQPTLLTFGFIAEARIAKIIEEVHSLCRVFSTK